MPGYGTEGNRGRIVRRIKLDGLKVASNVSALCQLHTIYANGQT